MFIKYYDIIVLSKTCEDVQYMNTRARIAVLSFTSLIILASQISLSFASYSSTKTVAASGTIAYPYIKSTTILKHLVVYPYTIDDELAAFIASHFNLVDFDFGATIGFEKIKALNPNVTMVGYRDIMAMHTWYEDWSEVNSHEDWFLHDVNGNRVMSAGYGWYAMDVGNAGWRSHYADFVKAKLAAYPMVDGIFADDVWDARYLDWGMLSVPLADIPLAVRTNWNSNMAGMIQYVKNALGDKLLIINTAEYNGDFLQYCDGQMIEGFVHASWEGLYDYSQDPIYDIGILERLSASGKIVMANSGANIPENPSTSDIEQTHKVMLYCLSGFLLGHSGNANFGFQCLHTDYTGDRGYWEEMDAPIGVPTGAKYNIQGDLWTRDFTNGKVFLNVGDANTYTVNVAGINYSVAPRSGLIVPG